ncbi:MAG: hypothetical protein KDH96_12835 [Candidatus Riesia sp.]|nr:hypothetical protein [Candidatus Riesia sp.]
MKYKIGDTITCVGNCGNIKLDGMKATIIGSRPNTDRYFIKLNNYHNDYMMVQGAAIEISSDQISDNIMINNEKFSIISIPNGEVIDLFKSETLSLSLFGIIKWDDSLESYIIKDEDLSYIKIKTPL